MQPLNTTVPQVTSVVTISPTQARWNFNVPLITLDFTDGFIVNGDIPIGISFTPGNAFCLLEYGVLVAPGVTWETYIPSIVATFTGGGSLAAQTGPMT